jgi:hypothetical protein
MEQRQKMASVEHALEPLRRTVGMSILMAAYAAFVG